MQALSGALDRQGRGQRFDGDHVVALVLIEGRYKLNIRKAHSFDEIHQPLRASEVVSPHRVGCPRVPTPKKQAAPRLLQQDAHNLSVVDVSTPGFVVLSRSPAPVWFSELILGSSLEVATISRAFEYVMLRP